MDLKVFLWHAKETPDYWFVMLETPGGKLLSAIPVITATAARLSREGIPQKIS